MQETIFGWLVRYRKLGEEESRRAMVDAPTRAVARALVLARLFPEAKQFRLGDTEPYRAVFRKLSATPRVIAMDLP